MTLGVVEMEKDIEAVKKDLLEELVEKYRRPPEPRPGGVTASELARKIGVDTKSAKGLLDADSTLVGEACMVNGHRVTVYYRKE